MAATGDEAVKLSQLKTALETPTRILYNQDGDYMTATELHSYVLNDAHKYEHTYNAVLYIYNADMFTEATRAVPFTFQSGNNNIFVSGEIPTIVRNSTRTIYTLFITITLAPTGIVAAINYGFDSDGATDGNLSTVGGTAIDILAISI